MTLPPKSVHLIISGRVQGVSYRAWTQKQAQMHGVDGWVRNRGDGTVEAVFSGEAMAVDALLFACGKGPLPAKVRDILVTPWKEEVQPGFTRLPTEP